MNEVVNQQNRIEFTTSPQESDLLFLTNRIVETTSSYGMWQPFAFFIKDDLQNMIAGCNGSLLFEVVYTDQLWVHADHRHKGLGRSLMEKVHAYAQENQCTMATVSTMSFQNSRAFYEKLGYEVDFERSGYAQGSSLLCLKMDF